MSEKYQYVIMETTVHSLFWEFVDNEANLNISNQEGVVELKEALAGRMLELAKEKLSEKTYDMLIMNMKDIVQQDIAKKHSVTQSTVYHRLIYSFYQLQKLAFNDEQALSIMNQLNELGVFDMRMAKKHKNKGVMAKRKNSYRAVKARRARIAAGIAKAKAEAKAEAKEGAKEDEPTQSETFQNAVGTAFKG